MSATASIVWTLDLQHGSPGISILPIKALRGRLPPLVLPSANLHRPLASVNLHRSSAHPTFTSTPFRESHQHALRRGGGPSSETSSSPPESSPSPIPASRLPSMLHLHRAPPASARVARAPSPTPHGARRDRRPPRRHRERVAQQSPVALTRLEP
jgi:hypothetical protein